jgi:hypothetical protein
MLMGSLVMTPLPLVKHIRREALPLRASPKMRAKKGTRFDTSKSLPFDPSETVVAGEGTKALNASMSD